MKKGIENNNNEGSKDETIQGMMNHSEKIEQVLRHEDKHPAAATSTPQRKEEFGWCKL